MWAGGIHSQGAGCSSCTGFLPGSAVPTPASPSSAMGPHPHLDIYYELHFRFRSCPCFKSLLPWSLTPKPAVEVLLVPTSFFSAWSLLWPPHHRTDPTQLCSSRTNAQGPARRPSPQMLPHYSSSPPGQSPGNLLPPTLSGCQSSLSVTVQ